MAWLSRICANADIPIPPAPMMLMVLSSVQTKGHMDSHDKRFADQSFRDFVA